MAMHADEIQQLIREAIPDAQVELEDARGDGEHYLARITSATFKDKSRVEQHQMVFAALGRRMGTELHALSIRTVVAK